MCDLQRGGNDMPYAAFQGQSQRRGALIGLQLDGFDLLRITHISRRTLRRAHGSACCFPFMERKCSQIEISRSHN